MTKNINLDDIDLNASPSVRAVINEDVVEQYARRYRASEPMPEITVFIGSEDDKAMLADGWHRYLAMAQAGITSADVNLLNGSYEDALRFALTANSRHGLPRTNEDKRRCIREALNQWPKMSNAALAKTCDVDDHTVADVRKEMEQSKQIRPSKTRVSSSGKEVPASRHPRKSEPGPVVDHNGTPVPLGIVQYWNRSSEASAKIETITGVMREIKSAMDSKDPMYAEVNFTGVLGDLEKARTALQTAIPFAVCTQCQGHPETQTGGCRLCLGRGLISKFRWTRLVPDEVKAIRVKA